MFVCFFIFVTYFCQTMIQQTIQQRSAFTEVFNIKAVSLCEN